MMLQLYLTLLSEEGSGPAPARNRAPAARRPAEPGSNRRETAGHRRAGPALGEEIVLFLDQHGRSSLLCALRTYIALAHRLDLRECSFKGAIRHGIKRRTFSKHRGQAKGATMWRRWRAALRCDESLPRTGRSPDLSDVARLTQLSRASVRRSLLTLQALGYVEGNGRYFSLSRKC